MLARVALIFLLAGVGCCTQSADRVRRVTSGVDEQIWTEEIGRLRNRLGTPSACLRGTVPLQHMVTWDADPGFSILIPARGAPGTAGLVVGRNDESPLGFDEVPC